MSDQPPKKRLSEISHLFLSSVRDRQTNGAQRPKRMPPGKRTDISIDLTPEEFAQAYGNANAGSDPERKVVPVSALIAAHLNGTQFDRVKQYARHLAGAIGRIGLIELDGSELRLMCFDPEGQSERSEADPMPECVEPRQMLEALEEMNWDVERWLVLMPNPRTAEAKQILHAIDHWVLLTTCDHDGVVSSYRMLKGLAETDRPRLTLSVLDAADDGECGRVYQKLSSVCQQFLDWTLDAEPPVRSAPDVGEHLALLYRPTHDKAQLVAAVQWGVVGEFLAAAKAVATAPTHVEPAPALSDEEAEDMAMSDKPVQLAAEVIPSPMKVTPQQKMQPQPASVPAAATSADTIDEVIDLPGLDTSGQAILAAVLQKAGSALIECPLRPPMLVEARLAVGRDRGILLLVAAKQGLEDLRSIGKAYQWLLENRELIGMALPQFSIDPRQSPRLRLLVDRTDLSAGALHPLLQSEHVTIQAYRKLRWGERLGVFLEAA